MVAVENGKPAPVPPLSPSTPDEERRHRSAQARRQLRKELAAREKREGHLG
jgi:acyl-CoA hydrolase